MDISSTKMHKGTKETGCWAQQTASIGDADITLSKFKKITLVDISTHGIVSIKTSESILDSGTKLTTITLSNEDGNEIKLNAFERGQE